MASSYPNLPRFGLGGRDILVPQPANRTIYGTRSTPAFRLAPANDNSRWNILAARNVKLLRRAMLHSVADFAFDTLNIAASYNRYEGEDYNTVTPPAPGAGWSWGFWNYTEIQCSVPTFPEYAAPGSTNCSATRVKTDPVPSFQYINNATELYRWRIDVLEFLSPSLGYRFRQRKLFELRLVRSGSAGSNAWMEVYPDGPPLFSPRYAKRTQILPAPFPRAYHPPKAATLPEINWQGNSAGPLPTPLAPPTPRPPRPGTKERKMVVAIAGVPQTLISAAGEIMDFVGAVHEALPKEFQAKSVWRNGRWWWPTPYDKAMAVYNHLDKLDLREAIINLLANQLEDRIFGTIGQISKNSLKNNPYYQRPVGWQTGPVL